MSNALSPTDSIILQQAWNLDQKALLNTKNKKEASLLWKKAILLCMGLLKKYPSDVNIHTKIATMYQHQGKFQNAKKILHRLEKYSAPMYRVSYNLGMGNLSRAMGKHVLALDYYQTAVRLSQNNPVFKKMYEDYTDLLHL